jgi:hypothetical protein
MESAPSPLTRRLSPLECLDAAIWFVRDHFAVWTALAAGPGILFAVALTAYGSVAGHVPAGTSLAAHFTRLQILTALLAVLFMLRGVGHWAAIGYFRRRVMAHDPSLAICLLAAFRHAASALFLAAFPAMVALGGFVLGIYPGLAAANAWFTAMPAAIFERLEAPVALRRSREIAGDTYAPLRVWFALFAVQLVIFLNLLLVAAILPFLLRMLVGIDLPALEQWVSSGNPVFLLLALALSYAATDALRVATSAIFYLSSRTEREGTDLLARVLQLRAGRGRIVEHELV